MSSAIKHFDGLVSIVEDISWIRDWKDFVDTIEIRPVLVMEEETLWEEEHPNAWGVYFRYNDIAIKNFNMNPCDWVADFDTEELATRFAGIIMAFIKPKYEL